MDYELIESASPADGIDTPGNLGLAVLERARADVGTREDLGRNDGHRIREYLGRLELDPPRHWCAAAVACWLWEAAQWLAVPMPIEGSPGAQATKGQLQAVGRWVGPGPGLVAALRPGNIVVWKRGNLDDPNEWRGHIGIVDSPPIGTSFGTIEGNSGKLGDRVARMVRKTTARSLLGVGILDTIDAPYTPTHAELEEAGRLMALGADVMRGEDADPLAALG